MKISVDMHVHLGSSKDGASLDSFHLLKILDEYSLSHAVVFPIDEPDPGPSFRNPNRKIAALAQKTKRIIGFCRLDPHRRAAAFHELEEGIENGLRGVKLHPRSEKFSPAGATDFLTEINKYEMPVMLHTSHEKNCRPAEWKRVFQRYKKIRFVLAHAGKDLYQEACEVALACPNVFLDTSTLSYYRTGIILRKAGARKVVFASDLPYSHTALEMLKFDLLLGKKSLAKRKVFEENPKIVLGDPL